VYLGSQLESTVAEAQVKRPPGFLASTTGKKIVMGLSGAVLFAFVIGHMAGNLQFFEGPEKLNAYSHFLHGVPEILWLVRLGLLAAVALHIWAAIGLTARKLDARPIGYGKKQNVASTYASRTMYWSGPILLAFIIYHLLHLTVGIVHPGSDFQEGDVYHNLVAGFSVWYVSAWYIFSMILLGLHIRHGAWSMFQSLGLNHPRHTPVLKRAAAFFAIVIVAGFISIPLSVLLGLVK
jgi:succinate dehydrogenase / fumarate reductase, cytochrome b subunit